MQPSGQGAVDDRSAAGFARRLAADERGVAAVEFALLLPLLATILLAAADLTTLASRSFQVQSLARSGAMAIARLPNIPPASAAASPGALNPITGSLPGALQAGSTGAANAYRPSGPLPSPLPILPPIAGLGLPGVSVASLISLPEGADASGILFWGCLQGAQLSAVRIPVCSGGGRAAPYAEVIVRAPVNRLVAWPDRILRSQVEARAVVRVG